MHGSLKHEKIVLITDDDGYGNNIYLNSCLREYNWSWVTEKNKAMRVDGKRVYCSEV